MTTNGTAPERGAPALRSRLPEPVKQVGRRVRTRIQRRTLRATTPLLSIVVPAYNVRAYIGECLDSLLGSTLSSLEVIVVDDGSTDGTFDIAREYAARDARVTVLTQTNSGQGIARNLGVTRARGEFLAFIDADDTVPPHAFRLMVKTLQTTGSDFVVGSARRVSNDRFRLTSWAHTVHQKDRFGVTIESFPLAMQDIIACNRTFRTEFWREKVGGFRGHIAYEDHVPMLTAYVRATKFDVLSRTTYNWRIREDLTSTSQQKRSLENLLDRVAVKEEAYDLLRAEAPESVYNTWVARAIEVDFPPFIQHALASSTMYRNVLSAAYKTFLGRAVPEAMAEVRYAQKSRAWLVAHERWEDLERAEAYFREVRVLPPIVVEGGKMLAEPVDFLEGAPPEIREMSPLETRFDAAIERSVWLDDDRLELTGWALVRGLDMREPGKTVAWFEREDTGERVDADITQLHLPEATVWARNINVNYDGAGFRIVLDPRTLVTEGVAESLWTLHLAVEHDGISRDGSVHRTIKGGSAESPCARMLEIGPDQMLFTPGIVREWGFAITVSRPRARLDEMTADGPRTVGGVLSALGNHTPRWVTATHERATERVPLTAAADGRFPFTLKFPPPAAGDWKINAEYDDGTDEMVMWGLGPPEGLLAGAGVRWEAGRLGGCRVRNDDDRLQVSALEVEGAELRVRLSAGAHPAERLPQARLGNERLSVSPARVTTQDGMTELVFPLETSVLGGQVRPLPSAKYRLTLPATGSSPEIRGVPDLRVLQATPIWFRTDVLHVRVIVPLDTDLVFQILPPFSDAERSLSGQKELQTAYQAATPEPAPSVLFGCYRGEFATDSQKALDIGLREGRPDLTRYWGVADYSVEVPDGSVPLLMNSSEWYDVLGSATYLCNNIDFDGFFRKKPHQKYLQTFHGYPFKSMGRTFWNGKGYSEERIARELERRNQEYDAILVPSEMCAEFYRQEYDYAGEILVSGYPRDDFLVNADRDRVRSEVLGRLGVPLGSTAVLYAPTYRDSLTTRTYAAKLFEALDLRALTRRLGDDVVILLRGHNNNQREDERVNEIRNVVDVTDYPDINELTVAADAAILDYSSLRFDWALTGKPAVFFVPDIGDYFATRPPLFSFEGSAPGPLLSTTDEVAKALSDLPGLAARTREDIAAFNATFNGLHDGLATRRVIEQFFDA